MTVDIRDPPCIMRDEMQRDPFTESLARELAPVKIAEPQAFIATGRPRTHCIECWHYPHKAGRCADCDAAQCDNEQTRVSDDPAMPSQIAVARFEQRRRDRPAHLQLARQGLAAKKAQGIIPRDPS